MVRGRVLALLAVALMVRCGVAFGAEVVVYPTSWSSWGSTTVASGGLSDLQSDNDQRMVFASEPGSQVTSVVFWCDSGYSASQFSRITYEWQFQASHADTPSYLIYAEDSGTGGWTHVGGGLWTTTDQDFSWETTEVGTYMSDDGKLAAEICGCPQTGSDYTTGIDLMRIRLELHTSAPAAPSGLTASVTGPTQVRLEWSDSSDNEYKFKLERKTGAAGTWGEIAQATTGAVRYFDNSVAAGTTYYYRVCAYNALGDSAWSNEAEAVVPAPGPPNAPSNLSALARSSTQNDLCWNDNARDEDGFIVEYRLGSSGGFAYLATVERDYTRYSHTGLTGGQEYQYRVMAYNGLGNSSASDTASAIPHARTVVVVSSMPELQAAINAAAPGTTIEIADGTYTLATNGIFINDKSDLMIRGQSGDRSAVVIQGNGIDDWPEFCFKLYRSHHIVFEDLTMRDVYWHCVQVNEGSSDVIFRNLYMWDAGEGPIKTTIVSQDGPWCDNGLVEDCVIGYTDGSTRGAIEGVDLIASANWVFRRVEVYGCYGQPAHTGSPGWGIFAKGNSIDTTIDSCYFEDCGVAMSFGGGGTPDSYKRFYLPQEHTGGIMRNNVVVRTSRVIPINDVAIYMNKATDFRVYNNTLWTTSAGTSSIDSRFVESTGWIYNNICSQGLNLRDGGSAVESNNLWNASDTLFVDRLAGDFHLRTDALTAIDQGLDTTEWVARDMDGDLRPIGSGVDIGADEFAAGGHSLTVAASAVPTSLPAQGTCTLSATWSDTGTGHGIALWSWDDGGAGGSFVPSASVQSPTYTAPSNSTAADLTVTLTVTATCDGSVPALDSDSVDVVVRPAVAFSDVPPDHWAHDAIMACYNAGIVNGYPGNVYLPDLKVTRAQMAMYVSRALVGGGASLPAGPEEGTFPDVSADHWSYDGVEYAVEANVVGGYPGGTYQPTWVVTRGQMAVFIARAIVDPTGEEGLERYSPPVSASFGDVPTDYWAFKHIEYCVEEEVILGYSDGLYRPTRAVTRDQMAAYIARAFELLG